jgi:hypothetical protein
MIRTIRVYAAVTAICFVSVESAVALNRVVGQDDSTWTSARHDDVIQPSAVVTGEVVDPTGQRIPGAAVIIEFATGKRLEGKTDARGEFRFEDVMPGTHRVTAASVGFLEASAAVTVETGVTRHVILTLPVSGIASRITVTAPSPLGYDAPRAAAATRLNVPIIDTPVSR